MSTQFFKKDPSYMGPTIVQTYLKKEKNSNSVGRMFGTYNTRFFTLNLQTFEFFYTPKDHYQMKEIKRIDLTQVTSVVDKGTSRGNGEWHSQFIIYFEDKFMTLICQNDSARRLWIEAFENIIRNSDQKSLLWQSNHNQVKKKSLEKNVIEHVADKSHLIDPIVQEEIKEASPQPQEEKQMKQPEIPKQEVNDKKSESDSSEEEQQIKPVSKPKVKIQFKPSTLVKAIESKQRIKQYKRSSKDHWNQRVKPVLLALLKKVRKNISLKQFKEKETNSDKFSKKNSTNPIIKYTNDFDNESSRQDDKILLGGVENLDSNGKDNLNIGAHLAKNVGGTFSINPSEKTGRKSPISPSQMTKNISVNNLRKKHEINIFEDQQEQKENKQTLLEIEMNRQKSGKGWNESDRTLLKDIIGIQDEPEQPKTKPEIKTNYYDDDDDDYFKPIQKKSPRDNIKVIQQKKTDLNPPIISQNNHNDWDSDEMETQQKVLITKNKPERLRYDHESPYTQHELNNMKAKEIKKVTPAQNNYDDWDDDM